MEEMETDKDKTDTSLLSGKRRHEEDSSDQKNKKVCPEKNPTQSYENSGTHDTSKHKSSFLHLDSDLTERNEETNLSNSALEDDDTWSHPKTRKTRNRSKYHDKSFKLPEPTFFKYPVMIEDTCTGTDSYKNYGAATNQIWKMNRCGAIVSQRRCRTANKWMVECSTFTQQQALAQMTKIKTEKGFISIKAEIPMATTEGVIGPLNREWSEEQVADLINESCTLPIQRIQRLKKDGEPCSAVKIVFLTSELPSSIKVGTQYFCVEPFRKTVLRCLKCQKLDHIAATCTKKEPRCPRGCIRAHTNGVRECPRVKPEDWLCVNCNCKGHSAAYAGCPAKKKLQQAHELRAKKYMPLSVAIKACNAPPSSPPMYQRRSSTPENEVRASLALQDDPPLSWAQRTAGLGSFPRSPFKPDANKKMPSPDTKKSTAGLPAGCPQISSTPPGIPKHLGSSTSGSTGASTGAPSRSEGSQQDNLRPGGMVGARRSWALGAGGTSHASSSSSNQVSDTILTFLSDRLEKIEEKISKNNQEIRAEVQKIEKKLTDIENDRKKKIQSATSIINKNLSQNQDVVTKMAIEVVSSLIDTAQNGNTQSLMRVLYDLAPRESVSSLPTLPRMPDEIQTALFNVMGYSAEKNNV